MGSFSIWHWLLVAVVVLLLFGRGRISDVMGELGKGVTSFKKGLSSDDDKKDAHAVPPAPRLDSRASAEPRTVDAGELTREDDRAR